MPSAQSAVYTYSPKDWLKTDTYDTYDNNGNTLGSQLSGAATDTYDWKNRLIRRTTTEGRIIDITYNATGDRVIKSTGTSTVHYLVDRNNLTGYAQVVEELDSSLTVERAYIYGLDLIAQSQLMPPEDPAEWQISYYLYDGLGTVRGLADATGLVTDAYFYDAYGVLLNVIGVTPNAYLYTGEQYDPDLGLYFLRARYLNPNTGRFHTMDTFEGVRTDPQSLHKYLYAHANPVMGVDPSGKYPTLAGLSTALGVFGNLARIAMVSLRGLLGRASLVLGRKLFPGAPVGLARMVGAFYLSQFVLAVSAGLIDQGMRIAACGSLDKGESVYIQSIITRILSLVVRLNPMFASLAVVTGNAEPILNNAVLAYYVRKVAEHQNPLSAFMMDYCRVSLVWLLPNGFIVQQELEDVVL